MEENIKTQLFAKTSGKTGEHKIVFTSKEDLEKVQFFDVPEIDSDKTIEFDAEKKLEADEWFYVELDDEHKEMIKPYLDNVANTADINAITADDYMSIDTIYKTSGDEKSTSIIFQKITKTYHVINKHFLGFNGHPEILHQKNSIELSGKCDAYFNGHNRIYFRNFSTIRCWFNNIEDYYRSATEEEIEKIKSCSIVNFTVKFKIGIRNMKKIAAIASDENIKLNDIAFQNKLKEYAERYEESGLALGDDGRFEIKSDKELGTFLSLASGRYYTSEISGEKMEARETSKLTKAEEGK